MSRSVMDEIKQEVESNPIVIYMKGTRTAPQCGFSAAAVQVLEQYRVPFKDVNILADQEKWSALKVFSDWPTMPQIYIGGQFVGGCDILREMHAKGELAPLVQQATGGPKA
jgi:monothiol glutaredoxin